jgi:hypothetical protein
MVDVNAGNSKISVNKTGNGSQVGVSGDGSNIAVNTVNEGNSSVNVSAGQGGQVGVTTGSSNANVAVSIGGSIVKPAYCGDKTCQSGENCFLCSGDCGNCKEEMVVVSGVRVTQEIRSSERINVLVSGVENKVTIKKGTDVKYLLVGGVENDVFVEEGVALENVWVTGVRVKLHLPEGLEANIQTSGTQAETIRD